MNHSSLFNQKDYKIQQSEILYQGVLRLVRYHVRHRLFKGGWSEVFSREVLQRWSSVAILPYDPKRDRVILIEQFRAGGIGISNPWMIEIPAGIIPEQALPHEVANQEAKEEANCDVLSCVPICEYFVSPGGSNEYLYLYCGQIDASGVEGIHGLAEEHEDIRVINLSREEAFAKLTAGQIGTSPAVTALFWLQLNYERLQKIW